jgi:sugar lactone lactonase YvrE
MDRDGSNQVVIATDFNQPIGMCFDSANNLLVAEQAGRKISKFDSSGNKSLFKDMSGL